MAETFGEALAAVRTSRPGTTRDHLSQSELAGAAGFDHSYISRLERGQRAPSREAVLLLGRVLQTTPAELDRLLIAAGFLPQDPAGLLAGEPALAAAWRVLHDPAATDRDRAEFRELLGLLVRQFTRRRSAA
jgi:transcriptional regulator with XRE-family HTH domain